MAEEEQAGDLNGLTQPAPTNSDKKHITIPYDEWVEFKKQNERMLEALNGSNTSNSGGARKKRKRAGLRFLWEDFCIQGSHCKRESRSQISIAFELPITSVSALRPT